MALKQQAMNVPFFHAGGTLMVVISTGTTQLEVETDTGWVVLRDDAGIPVEFQGASQEHLSTGKYRFTGSATAFTDKRQ